MGVLGGDVGRGRVVRLDRSALELAVVLEAPPPPPLPVTLVLALPRPRFLKRVLLTAASMGVKRLILLHTRRVEKSFWQSPALRPGAVRESLLLGLEQARDTRLPDVETRRSFRRFVDEELPGLARDSLALAAHPGAGTPCPRGVGGRVTLAVGPEGGFVEEEIARLATAGFQPVQLGEPLGGRPLRVEAAVPALLARLF